MEKNAASSQYLVCHLCGGEHFRNLETAEDSVRVLECRNCSLVFLDPQPGPKSLAEHYDKQYYHSWLTRQRHRRLKMWKRRIRRLEKLRSPGRLLDVGCGEGLFLQIAKRRGWRISGTEISRFAAEHAEKAAGCEVFCGDLTDAGYADQSFDLLTLWHVLEHVRDPLAYLCEARRIVAESGMIVVAVPNLNNVFMKAAYRLFKGKPLRLYEPDERELHLFHFSDRTLSRVLTMAGFRVMRIGPDTGNVDRRKQIIDAFSVSVSKATGCRTYNALEAIASPAMT